MEKVVAIIPALNPLNSLLQFVEELFTLEFEKIIIVNDGSDEKYKSIFDQLNQLEKCIVIEHEQNYGKGKALKTGFHYILKSLPKTRALLTVGAHGQHKIEDIKLIISNAKIFSDGIILGIRNFNSREVPFWSSLGNQAATILFQLLFHKRILDTQTGLRFIPKKELSWLLNVSGDSYSYDTNMLVEAIDRKVPIYEIPIGHLEFRKNSIIYYDEILNMKKVIQQIIKSYTRHRNAPK